MPAGICRSGAVVVANRGVGWNWSEVLQGDALTFTK